MTKRLLGYVVGTFVLGAGVLYSACGDVDASDCRIKCDNAHNTCTEKCKDDVCKTTCTTDLNDCRASCEKVAVTRPDAG